MTEIGRGEQKESPPDSLGQASVEERPRRQVVDWLAIIYLGIGAVLLPFGFPDTKAFVFLGIHLALIAILLTVRRWGLHRSAVGGALLAFYPVALLGFFYSEVGYLDLLFHDDMFDSTIQRIEESIFGGQPSATLYQRLSSRILGEYLHLGYVSYYFLMPVLIAVLWFTQRRAQYYLAIATISLSFYICFLFFIFFPVAGPYQVNPPLPVDQVGLFLPGVTRFILDRGSSVGAAFPSSHVAVGVTTWIMAIRFHPGLGLIYAFLVPPLAVGAIYGGYHYATDIVAGAVLGLLCGTLGLWFVRSLDRR